MEDGVVVVPKVRGHVAGQEAQYFSVLCVDAQEARRSSESDAFKVPQQFMDLGTIYGHRTPHGVAHPDNARCHTTPQKRTFGI